MRLRNRELLIKYMEASGVTGAGLARSAQCSRQFIYSLRNGDRTTCTPKLAKLVEEALRVVPGTLFVDSKSHDSRLAVKRQATAA